MGVLLTARMNSGGGLEADRSTRKTFEFHAKGERAGRTGSAPLPLTITCVVANVLINCGLSTSHVLPATISNC